MMNVLGEYVFNYLRKNKRYTISIILAITIASTLLCSLCIYGHTVWRGRVNTVIKNAGYWHGELRDDVLGERLKYVTENPYIQTTLIKGQWVTAKLSNTKRPYLLMRDADQNYWEDMSERRALIKGRLPKKPGEIVISKLFFNDNSSYRIGDMITLPIGSRMLQNVEINTQMQEREGEKNVSYRWGARYYC